MISSSHAWDASDIVAAPQWLPTNSYHFFFIPNLQELEALVWVLLLSTCTDWYLYKDVEQLHHEQYLAKCTVYISELATVLEEYGSLFHEKGQDLATSYSFYKIYVTGFGKTHHNVTNDILRNTNLKFWSRHGSLVLDCSHTRFAVQLEQSWLVFHDHLK